MFTKSRIVSSTLCASSRKCTTRASFEGYGSSLFKGKVAAPYLEKQGLSKNELESSAWVRDAKKADAVSSYIYIFTYSTITIDCHIYYNYCHFH